MSLRDELIQVAAVAVAIVEDLDHGQTLHERAISLDEIYEERVRQNAKWGRQHHPIEKWLAILIEEVGEAAKAALDDIIFPQRNEPAEVLPDFLALERR